MKRLSYGPTWLCRLHTRLWRKTGRPMVSIPQQVTAWRFHSAVARIVERRAGCCEMPPVPVPWQAYV